jgi:predicted ATP-grasp superfamily ATP-dependent carboligase
MARRPATDGSVVIPAVYAPHAVTCLRSLGRRDVHTIAAYERTTPAFSSRYCDESVLTPSPTEDAVGYRDELLSLASRDDVRAIVPMREADVYVLSRYEEAFAEHVAPRWPAFESLEVVHDRARLVEAADAAGVPRPETHLLDEVDDWRPRQIVKARYALLTPDQSVPGVSDRLLEPSSITYLDHGEKPDRAAIRGDMSHDPIVQEYVPGDEYAFWALYDEGEPVATCHKHQIRGRNYAGGTSVYRRTTREPRLEEVGRALLDHLEWDGFASVQFKKDATTGEFKLLEINPRVWVSVNCPVRAGVDFPYCYWRLAGDASPDPATYEGGVGTHYLLGELMHLWSVLGDDEPFVEPPSISGSVRDVVSSLYGDPRYDYLDPDDPVPFVHDALSRVTALGKRVA